jgi:UDP-3-O-[3-hydroxymyristoyl] glucosamine N-acyltransferase
MKKQPEKSPPPLSVGELSRLLSCPFEGDGATEIRGVSSLDKAKKGDLVFLAHRKYLSFLERSKASAAIIPSGERYERIPVIKSENPHKSFVKAVEIFYKPYRPEVGINASALVSPSAKIGKDVSIGPFTFIGDEAEIGDKTVIFPFVAVYPQVKIGKETVIHSHVSVREKVKIGNRVIIHNGAVIGSDGFGYLQDKDRSHIKIPQVGTVIIEDDVEVGANTTVDRAALGETIIKKGTKIDNLVQVAHNVELGPHSILAAQVGISGSTKIGKNVIMGGQAGVADHVNIGDNVMVAARTGIIKDVPSNSVIAGFPHLDIKEWRKSSAMLPKLYDLAKEVKRLKKKVEELEKKTKKSEKKL